MPLTCGACRTGAFGTVTKELLDGSQEVAVKRMAGRVDNATLQCFATEIDLMKRCRCVLQSPEHTHHRES